MTDGVRRLSHEEAEMLISARMDEQLDRADSRALLVHLQTCGSCRAFAVQSEVLGRELAALPVLPPSAIVDRQIRESIAKGNKRWSLAGLLPVTGGSSGLRTAIGALAVLTLVSVFLLVRMASDRDSTGPSINAPTGGVAQQLDRTPTSALAMAQGQTETPQVVAPAAQQTETAQISEPTQAAAQPTEPTSGDEAPPTATLDSTYVYAIDKTKTPKTGGAAQTPTEEPGAVVAAAVGGVEGTPVASAAPTEPVSPPGEGDGTGVDATATPDDSSEDSDLASPTETPAEPTMTPTPVEISVDATQEIDEPATQPPASDESTESAGDNPTESAVASSAPESPPTETPVQVQPTDAPPAESPAPLDTPAGPFTQPTIAPISGQSAPQHDESGKSSGNDHSGNDYSGNQPTGASDDAGQSPQIVPSDGSSVEAASTGDETDTGSPPIVSTNGTQVAGDAGATGETATESGVGGETQPPEASAIPTVDASIEPAGLDLSETVAELPAGTSSPLGRLEFSPGMNLYAVIAPDGQLAIANLDGELVVTLGSGELPVWSGSAMMFSAPGDNGTVVGIWDSESGNLSYVPASDEESSSDLPIGGDGSTFYFLRTFPDRPGAMEIHSSTIDGSDGGTIWTSDSVTLGGARPAWSSNGILLPTDSSWLLIGTDGSESDLGENPYGYVGAPVLSPGEGLLAYSAGDQVVVAWADAPGTAVATTSFGGSNGGYAFSTSGEQIVVSDGSSLHVVSYEGDDLGTLGGNQPIGGVYWISDTIYYVQIGEDAALKATSLDAIQGG